MSRFGWAVLLAAAVAACGVKAPPRPPGAATAPPHDLFKPGPEQGPVPDQPITVGPQAPAPAPGSDAPAPAPAAPAAPTPGQEPKP
jgi:hypothetical protein